MDKKQFLIIMTGLKSNYQNWKIDLQDRIVLELWYENLKDIPYEIIQLGIRKLLAEEEFYPNIAKIRKACASIQSAPVTDTTQAWGLVQKAIRRYGYMRAEEAFESLPADVVQAIGYVGGWGTLCESTNVEADRAHFYRCMDQITSRSQSKYLLPLDLQSEIDGHRQLELKKSQEGLEGIGQILGGLTRV